MSKIAAVGGNLLKKAVALRVGKALLTKPVAMVGLGIGAVAGASYLAYSFFDKRKKEKKEEDARREHIRRIDDLDDNHPGIDGDKKIVI
ncbi:hypothetical protein BH23BAC2_BH23BAC2_20540 [soil metagenome]